MKLKSLCSLNCQTQIYKNNFLPVIKPEMCSILLNIFKENFVKSMQASLPSWLSSVHRHHILVLTSLDQQWRPQTSHLIHSSDLSQDPGKWSIIDINLICHKYWKDSTENFHYDEHFFYYLSKHRFEHGFYLLTLGTWTVSKNIYDCLFISA